LGALLVTARDSTAQSGGAALSFAILGGPAVTCTRSTVTTGDIGVASTSAFTNTGCTISGNIHAGDALAAQAYNDYLSAYDAIAAKPCSGAPLTGTLAGRNLAPGVYCVSAEAKTGVLTLLKGNILSGAAITLTRGSFIGRAGESRGDVD
jgi:hypothetical protein